MSTEKSTIEQPIAEQKLDQLAANICKRESGHRFNNVAPKPGSTSGAKCLSRSPTFHRWFISVLCLTIMVGSAAFVVANAASDGTTANLAVRIENISTQRGILRIGMYDQKNYPDNDAEPVASADVPVAGGAVTIVLRGLMPGEYALQTFQDLNENGRMDTTWLGVPKEPFGFSRDARPRLQKPPFAKVKFALSRGENSQIIHLQSRVDLLP